MQPSEAFQQQLKATYAAIVDETFDRARHCLGLARVAQQVGDCAQVRKWGCGRCAGTTLLAASE